jgi:hypothetical protein
MWYNNNILYAHIPVHVQTALLRMMLCWIFYEEIYAVHFSTTYTIERCIQVLLVTYCNSILTSNHSEKKGSETAKVQRIQKRKLPIIKYI